MRFGVFGVFFAVLRWRRGDMLPTLSVIDSLFLFNPIRISHPFVANLHIS